MRGEPQGTVLLLGVAILGLTGPLLLPTASAYMRIDPPDPHYVTAYLNWNSEPKLVWDESKPSEDNKGRTDFATTVANDAGWQLRHYSQGQQGKEYVTRDVFVSEPVPQDIELNVSRLIQLDLYLKQETGGCPGVDVELRIGDDQLVTGQLANPSNGFHSTWGPKNVPGYCNRFFRMHSEVDRIPAGSILKLHVILVYAYTSPPIYGLTGDHRSQIRFPFFPPEELLYRRPPPPPPEGSAPDEEANLIPIGALALAPLLALRRRGDSRVLLLAALLAGAGCLGAAPKAETGNGSPAATGGTLDATFVPLEGGGTGNGTIAGLLHDEEHIPIAGAHVTLIGMSRFDDTDSRGRFRLDTIPAGRYGLRIDHAEFKPLEQEVEVRANQVSMLTVTLEPLDRVGRDYRPHRHDLWESDSQPLWSGSLPAPSGFTAGVWTQTFNLALQPDPEKRLVLPGTRDIEVKLSWDPNQNKIERAGIAFWANNDPLRHYSDQPNLTFMHPKGNGATTHIRTTWEMTDIGHQKFTTWLFQIYVPGAGGKVGTGYQQLQGPFHVEMTLKKGSVPLEPSHRSFWGDNQTITIWNRLELYNPVANDPYIPPKMVPPGTGWIEMVYEQARVSNRDFKIYYKPANLPLIAYSDESNYLLATPHKVEGAKEYYRIDLKPGEPDAFYSKATLWRFSHQVSTERDVPWTQDYIDERVNGAQKFHLTVILHRDPQANVR